MTAKTESFSSDTPRIEPRPFADLRILAVRADQPTVGKSFLRSRHSLCIDLRDARAPAELHARFDCVVHEQLMQFYAAHGIARRARKIRARGMFLRPQTEFLEMESAFRAERKCRALLGQQRPGAGCPLRRACRSEDFGHPEQWRCSPRLRAAIAATIPAGPAPTTMTLLSLVTIKRSDAANERGVVLPPRNQL